MIAIVEHEVIAPDGKRIPFRMPEGIDEKTIQQRGEQLLRWHKDPPSFAKSLAEETRKLQAR